MLSESRKTIHKSLIVTCLIVTGASCASGSQSVAEVQAVSRHPKVSIDLGSVTVWLGMPQTDALLQFQSAGYKVLGDSTASERQILNGDHIYTIWFKGGTVACADREWYSSGRDEMDAVLGALAAMSSHGTNSCSIIHDNINEPQKLVERILIGCGQRSVLLIKGKIEVSNEVKYVIDVFERIGQIP